jgi:hypothetical protein
LELNALIRPEYVSVEVPDMPSLQIQPDVAAFYTTQSAFSDPGSLLPLYAELPADPAHLAQITRDLMIHRVESELFGYPIPPDRLHNDAETRYLDDILRTIVGRNDAPLSRRREVGDRFVGICRDFSLMLCSFLRHLGVPARLRIGFADYFGTDGFHFDHVVTEYWDDDRGWLLADAQLPDPRVIDAHSIDFDPVDVPRDRFLVAGTAWRLIRSGEADAETFGLPDVGVGESWVAGNLRLDLAALNRAEVLLWDAWGPDPGPGEPLTAEVRDLFDQVAPLTGDEVPFAAARARFTEHDDLRLPKTATSHAVACRLQRPRRGHLPRLSRQSREVVRRVASPCAGCRCSR